MKHITIDPARAARLGSLSDQYRAARAAEDIAGLLALADLAARSSAAIKAEDETLGALAFSMKVLRLAKRARTWAVFFSLQKHGHHADMSPFADKMWPELEERLAAIAEANAIHDEKDAEWHTKKALASLTKTLAHFDEVDKGENAAVLS